MIVAVIAIRMVQMTVHQIIDVVTMGDCLVTAICAMLVLGRMCVAVMTIGAICWIRCSDVELVLIDMPLVERVQMSVMEIIGVIVVDNRGVAAILAMLMRMIFVDLMLI